MNRTLIILAILALFSSCCARRVVLNNSTTDSVRIVRETEYIERWRDTTIYVTLPAERIEVIRRDSSFLSTDLATSTARINEDGLLYHSLENKVKALPVDVSVKDTEQKAVEVTGQKTEKVVEVAVRMPMRWWEKALFYSGILFWGVLAGYVIVKIRK